MATTCTEAEAPTRPHLVIDPRIRQRWVDVRRQEGRRRLRILAAVCLLVALAAGGLGLLHTPVARVRHVRIATVPAVPVALVRRTTGLEGGALMVGVDAGADERRLEALPAVATARVERQWPGTVRVEVTARSPVAVVGTGPGALVVDRTGRVLSTAAGGLGTGLPVVNGPVSTAAVGAWLAGTAGPGAAALAATDPSGTTPQGPSGAVTGGGTLPAELALATALPPSVARSVSSISTAPADGLVAVVATTTVVFGDSTQLPAKVVALGALLAHGPLTGLARIDLRVPDRPAAIPVPARH